jgi:hypothetical protein
MLALFDKILIFDCLLFEEEVALGVSGISSS